LNLGPTDLRETKKPTNYSLRFVMYEKDLVSGPSKET
jgi:hypothetical protein